MKKDIKWLIQELEKIADKHPDLEVVDMGLSVREETEWMALDSYGGMKKKELNVTLRNDGVEFICSLHRD